MASKTKVKNFKPVRIGTPAHRLRPDRSERKRRFWLLNTICRLTTWFSIITILFRCPAKVDLVRENSPRICKPYFQVKSAISPHLQPYYDIYAAPYIELARPSYDLAERLVVEPTKTFLLKHSAPRVAQAKILGKKYWIFVIQPQVQKYQGIIYEQYHQKLGLHLDSTYTYVNPYYEAVKININIIIYKFLLPTYNTAQPYIIKGSEAIYNFTVNTAYPWTKWSYKTTANFLCKTVAPTLKTLYGQKVEPQLVRIGERLRRSRDGKKIMQTVTEIKSSSTLVTEKSPLTSVETSSPYLSQSHTPIESPSSSPDSSPTSELDPRVKAQQIVSRDLREWQEKFAKAADEGADELESRITEIVEEFIRTQSKVKGRALIKELEQAIESILLDLKNDIVSIVRDSNGTIDSKHAISTAVRKAGMSVKDRVQAVRDWKQKTNQDLTYLVNKAKSETLEILDIIQDAGLQEIGMRWAWTDGITHKDWAKYHTLKTKFSEWREDIVLLGSEHSHLLRARLYFEEIESEAMAIAESTANELAMLKETGVKELSSKSSYVKFSSSYSSSVVSSTDQKGPLSSQISGLTDPSQPEKLLKVQTSVADSFSDFGTASQSENSQRTTRTRISNVLESSRLEPDLDDKSASKIISSVA